MKLSPHFSLEEMTFSETGIRHNINNIPGVEEKAALVYLTKNCLEVIRLELSIEYSREIPLRVSSGFRNRAINKLVGGVEKIVNGKVILSQHCRGEAADLKAVGLSVFEFFKFIKRKVLEGKIPADQVILEYNSWVHVSCSKFQNRKQFLKINHDGRGYLPA